MFIFSSLSREVVIFTFKTISREGGGREGGGGVGEGEGRGRRGGVDREGKEFDSGGGGGEGGGGGKGKEVRVEGGWGGDVKKNFLTKKE